MTSFDSLTPLEQMSLGDRERIHTALLAWLLGGDSPLVPASRGRIASALAERPSRETTGTSSDTEVKGLDVLVLLDDADGGWALAVEAKLKSQEHSNQLARYDAALALRTQPVAKIFLTLAGDPPSTPGWRAVSYERLAAALRAEIPNNSPSLYARDYLAMVERLAAAVKVLESDAAASVLFGDSTQVLSEHPGFVEFTTRLRLTRILQQVWMSRLCAMTLRHTPLRGEWRVEVDETHGAALLNVQNSDRHPGYCVGLQLQHRAIKLFCYPLGDEPLQAAIEGAAQILAGMAAKAKISAPPTKQKGRGFTSVLLERGPNGRDLSQWSRTVARCLLVTMDAVDAASPGAHGA